MFGIPSSQKAGAKHHRHGADSDADRFQNSLAMRSQQSVAIGTLHISDLTISRHPIAGLHDSLSICWGDPVR